MTFNHLKLTLLGIVLFAFVPVRAQKILVGVGGGGGTFNMGSTKEFNQSVVNLLPFKPVVTDNFPPWIFEQVEALYCFPKNLAIGFNLSATSTGSRLSLADYSGKYTFDNVQRGFFPGIKLLFGKAPGRLNNLNFSLELGASFSKMTLKEDMKVYADSTLSNSDFNAMGLFVQPGFCYFYQINSKLRVSATVSYYYGIEKGYHLPKAKGQRLINPETHNPVKPQWDGIRVGITAYWSLQ